MSIWCLFFTRIYAHTKYNLNFKQIVQQICSLICNDIYQIYESTINNKAININIGDYNYKVEIE